MSVLLSLSFFLESPMASASSGSLRASATGAPSVNVVTDFLSVDARRLSKREAAWE